MDIAFFGHILYKSATMMKVAIIGGGAAGMMAAATIAENQPDVEIFLIEKNTILGRKVIISGGGRCNVTTGLKAVPKVLESYPRGDKFLISAMTNFPPEKVYEWFESHGVPLKTENDLRVFPKSNDGQDVVKVFGKILHEANAEILLKHDVKQISHENGKFIIEFRDMLKNDAMRGGEELPSETYETIRRIGNSEDDKALRVFQHVLKNGEKIQVDKVIITTGGQAYRFTGSSGDGYDFAENLGHTITKLAPSLNSFITLETWPKNLAGVSMQKAAIRADRDKKYKFTGPFLFTHKGISGPAVFALSSLVAFEDYDKNHPLQIYIDLVPDLTAMEFEAEILKEIRENPKRTIQNNIHAFLPRSLITELLSQLKIPEEKRNCELSKKDTQSVSHLIKNLPLKVIDRESGDEFVTAGGVNLNEVDSKTMQSKICPGLYFAGEILDIDGFTGGFNLQASWATGKLAGESAGT
ncbi:NAD(P)/FAD-dependent oxidoreductase [Candidatus Peregrinibacteria bacterium]|nr:NAD(P)/FAD-dependent oxidoreductase [Candidatus Peregrinibacteria bacterium]